MTKPKHPPFDPLDRRTDPSIMAGPGTFRKILGHKDTTTISGWVKHGGPIPDPEDWEDLPSGRRRPLWSLGTMWAHADQAPRRGHAGGWGARPRPPHRYAGDPRLALARQLLAEHPTAPVADLVGELQRRWTGARGSSVTTWQNIIRTAKTTDPTEQDT